MRITCLCRQAWQGGALTPNASIPEHTTKPRARVSPASCWGVTYTRRGRPSPSRQAPPPSQVIPQTLQATTDPKPPVLGVSSSKQGEEEVGPTVSAAALAMEVADALPAHTSSSQPQPIAVSVSVSVRDNPVSTSAFASHSHPTLLPHASSPPNTSASCQGPLVLPVPTNPAAGQGQSSQPSDGHGRQHSPPHPTQAERQSHTPASLMSAAPRIVQDAATSSLQTVGEVAHPAGSSGPVEQPSALDPPMTGNTSHPPPSEAGHLDYNLSSAISHQFESLPIRSSPRPMPHSWRYPRPPVPEHQPGPMPPSSGDARPPKPQPEAGTSDVSVQPPQDVPVMDPSLSHPFKLAERLISDSFDRLGQGNSGGEGAAASEADRPTDDRLKPDQVRQPSREGSPTGQDNGDSDQQQTQKQGGDAPVQAGSAW